jgi:hypothetical protein
MKIPNHILFGEKIANLAESGGAYFEFTVLFTISPMNCENIYGRIDIFMDKIKNYAVVENKTDWEVL